MVFTDKINIVMHHSSQGMYKKNILSKSLNIEVFKSSCSILLIFFLLVVGSRVVGYFEQAAEGYIDPSIIMNVVFLRFPDFITLLIPLSFFLGVMITVSRLYAEREIYGFFSVGLAPINLVKFLLPQAIIYFVLTLILSLFLAPYTKAISQELLSTDSYKEQINSIKPQKIFSLKDGSGFIYADEVIDQNLIRIKFLRTNSKKSFLVTAEELKTKENLDNFELNFIKGSLYQDLFAESSSIVSNFGDLKLSLDIDESRLETISLTKLFDYSSSSDDASFQWNVSIPITIIVLLFMGVYMSSVSPRQGRFAVILPGMLMYVTYLSLLILGRESIAENPNSAVGLWWVHLLFAMVLVIYISKDKISLNIISGGIWKESKYSKFPLGLILLLLLFWLVI